MSQAMSLILLRTSAAFSPVLVTTANFLYARTTLLIDHKVEAEVTNDQTKTKNCGLYTTPSRVVVQNTRVVLFMSDSKDP